MLADGEKTGGWHIAEGLGGQGDSGGKLGKRLGESNRDVARKVASIEKAPDSNPEPAPNCPPPAPSSTKLHKCPSFGGCRFFLSHRHHIVARHAAFSAVAFDDLIEVAVSNVDVLGLVDGPAGWCHSLVG